MSPLVLWVGGLSIAVGAVLAHRLYLMRTPTSGGEISGRLSTREWTLLFWSMGLIWVGLLTTLATVFQ